MMTTYSDTTHGRFIEHMDLARQWVHRLGQRTTQAQVLRTMRRLDLATLRRLLATTSSETFAEADARIAAESRQGD